MTRRRTLSRYLLCVANEGFPASLVVRRVYRQIQDRDALTHGLVRVVDESGEDYLFPKDLFLPIALPRGAGRAFSRAG
jgi:hypothetical protein